MEFRILGPLDVLDDRRAITLGGSKQRALLALLLLHANETLSTERLIDELWGERPPNTAAKTVQMHVSRLRKALGGEAGADSAGVIVTRERGYELRLDPERLDLHRFEGLVSEGRNEVAGGHPERAVSFFEEALGLWRGAPLAELANEPFAQREIARLDDLRVAALEQLIEAKLMLGEHAEVVGHLTALIGEHPYRERLRAQLMLALYRCDRQADALQAYQDARRTLAEELGIEPTERLRELERAILAHDPALAASAPTTSDDRESSSPSPALPTGVVTFLLTDIEGSSRLWEADSEAMAAALDLHDELIAATAEAHGGRLLKAKGEGDATLTVFRRASDAVVCAVALQGALTGASWPGGLDLRVRMALHTGEAHERGGDYFGPALNRAARLRGLVRGGATVLSQTTAQIVHERLPREVALVELGQHRLRGLSRPENVFELRVTGRTVPTHESMLDASHAVVATRPDGMGRLPTPPTSTIGREADCKAIAQLLRRDEIRLVTLTGAGGVGKTRLAVEVARRIQPEFPGGVWLVSLAATTNPDHAPSTVAQALDVVPMQGETPKQAVERFLRSRRALVALDNFEHLLAAAPSVSELLAACPQVTVLATSREALRLEAEHRYEVVPLRVPGAGNVAEVESAAAGALFVDRARTRDRDFELTSVNARAIADVCQRLDGLPLAIELAAARTALLGVEELSRRLAQALDVLGTGPRDAPARQRTLRATIEWSHRLLSAPEAEAFARFAVFAGGATLEAAEHVTGAHLDVLEGLVEKNLVLRRSGRLLMLETVREYARERLDACDDSTDVRMRHVGHYMDLMELAEPQLWTRGEAEWLPRLNAEVDNLRAALDWSIRHGDPNQALRLAGTSGKFWQVRGATEGLEWLAAAIATAGETAPIEDRARARRAQVSLLADEGAVYDTHGLREQTRATTVVALALSREAGDPAGIAEALIELGFYDTTESFPQAKRRALAEEALACAREAGNDRLEAHALMERALTLPPSMGMAELEQAEAALRKLGSARLLVSLYNNAAYNALKEGMPELGRPLLDRAAPILSELGDPVLQTVQQGHIGLEALFSGDIERAKAAFEAQLRLCRDHAVANHLACEGLGGIAAIAAHRGDPERAARLLGAANTVGPIGDADINGHLEQHFFSAARKQLGSREWRAAEVGGAAAGFEDAVALALAEAPSGAVP